MVLLWLLAWVSTAHAGLPLIGVDISAQVEGPVAEVVIDQVFRNDTGRAVDGTYVFPLHERAAVDAVTFRIGDRIIRSRVEERQTAQQRFDQARRQGKTAVLTTQQRPNLFTQELANVPPGQDLVVRLHLVQPVPFEGGAYELVLPTRVAPRFATSASELEAIEPTAQGDAESTWSVDVHLRASLPFLEVWSPTHPLLVVEEGHHRFRWQAEIVPDRDVVLRWETVDQRVHAGLVIQGDQAVVTIQPPRRPPPGRRIPREILWVVDRSCSMEGGPLSLAKVAMHRALDRMDGADATRVLAFSDTIDNEGEAERVTPRVRAEQQAFVRGLEVDGGTWLLESVQAALETPRRPGHERLIVYLTDGLVQDDEEMLAALARTIGDNRLYVFAVGPSPNRYLLSELARLGRGRAVYLRDGEPAEVVLDRFLDAIDAPLLTDVHIDWGDWRVERPWPRELPALHAGQPLHLHARILEHGSSPIEISGHLGGGQWVQDVEPELAGPGRALESAWARTKIEGLERRMRAGDADPSLRAEIVQTSIDHQVLSRFTAFLGIDPSRQPPPTPPTSGAVRDRRVQGQVVSELSVGRRVSGRRVARVADRAAVTPAVSSIDAVEVDAEVEVLENTATTVRSAGDPAPFCLGCGWRDRIAWWAVPGGAVPPLSKEPRVLARIEGGPGLGGEAHTLGARAGVAGGLWGDRVLVRGVVDHRASRFGEDRLNSSLVHGYAVARGRRIGAYVGGSGLRIDASSGLSNELAGTGEAGVDLAFGEPVLSVSGKLSAVRTTEDEVFSERHVATHLKLPFKAIRGRHFVDLGARIAPHRWTRPAILRHDAPLSHAVDASLAPLELSVSTTSTRGRLDIDLDAQAASQGGRLPVSAGGRVGMALSGSLDAWVEASHRRDALGVWAIAAGHSPLRARRQDAVAGVQVGGPLEMVIEGRLRRWRDLPALDGTRVSRDLAAGRVILRENAWSRPYASASYTFAHVLNGNLEPVLVDDHEILRQRHRLVGQLGYLFFPERFRLDAGLSGGLAAGPLGVVLAAPGSRAFSNLPRAHLAGQLSQTLSRRRNAVVLHARVEHRWLLDDRAEPARVLPSLTPDPLLTPAAQGTWVSFGIMVQR